MAPFTEDEFPREKCGKCGWVHYHNPRPTVSAIIVRNGKILLCHRSADPCKGKWDLLKEDLWKKKKLRKTE